MRRILDVLRLRLGVEPLSDRRTARSLGVPRTTVRDYVVRFRATGLAWPLVPELDEAALERALFARAVTPPAASRPLPDWALIAREKKQKGVTLQLLWQEYRVREPAGYAYSQFAEHYRRWRAQLDPVLRQEYRAGERAFVDYAGLTVDVVDPTTGEVRTAQIFVAALGASNYTYTEATWTQQLPDWIASHVRMLEYFGGVPALIIPDNLKTGVTYASYYEPEINPTYAEWAAQYGTAILPTRVVSPRDKAKVETAVQIVEREILAPMRHHTFTSLAELNQAIRERLERLNTRPFQKLAGTRRTLFEALDRGALRALPADRYEYAEWRTAKVNIDYHIAVETHFYSVPYQLVRAVVTVRLTAAMLEVLHNGVRVAAHPRRHTRGCYSTDPAHRPKSHQRHLEWTPSRLVRWGTSIGAATGAVVTHILDTKPHPEMGYRACLGLFSLEKRFGRARLEAAAARAQASGAMSYRSILSILKQGLDQAPLVDAAATRLPPTHDNVRGAAYYASAPAADAQLTLITGDV
ncbi:MAG TPA: IS21 family transposase [Gemmatimonadaceae bacterium]|jgi:transposase